MNDKGHPVLSVINLGKTDSKLDVRLKNATIGTTCTDLINGVVVSSKPTLKPNEVFFVEITDDNKLPTATSKLLPKASNSSFIYPNPTSGKFRIELEKQVDEVHVSVTNMSGQAVLSRTYFNVNAIDEHLDEKSDGVYLVNLQTKNSVQTFVIIKRG